jgi:hypothetical protein
MFELIYLHSMHLTAFEFAVRLRHDRSATMETGGQVRTGK